MMERLHSWILQIAAAAFFIMLIQNLTPEGTVKKIENIVSGFLLLLILLSPFRQIQLQELTMSFDDYLEQIEVQTERYQQERSMEWQALIQENTAAYIRDKAKELGLECEVEVTVQLDEQQIPYPAEVSIKGKFDQEMEEYLETELGIEKERQHWTDGKNEENGLDTMEGSAG